VAHHGTSGLSLALWAGIGIAGCSDPSHSARIRAELVRLPGSASAAPASVRLPGPTGSLVRPWSSLLNISSLRGPVKKVLINGPVQTIEVYRCPGAHADDCLVELNSPALQDLLNTAPIVIVPGTYDHVRIEYCDFEMGYRAYLAGSVVIGGTTYYTRTAGNLGAVGPAEPVPLAYNGCVSEYAIATPLVVADTIVAPIVLRLYFDIRDIGYASLADPTTTPLYGFGCTPVVPPGTAPFVCAAYPSIAAVEGLDLPVVERYRVNGGATIGLLFEAGTDRFVGGYFRRYVDEDRAWSPLFTPDSFVESLTANSDGSYQIHQVDGATFPAFRRATHSGTATRHDGVSFAYSALRLP
jgi:hypothetical protein